MISATRYRALAEMNRQSDLASQIAKLQESVSSGKRISKPSDDPEASNRVSEIRQTQADQVTWTNNINQGTSIASAADAQLGAIADQLNRAKELVLSGRNDTTSPADRAATAAELRALASDLDNSSKVSGPTGAPLFPSGTPLLLPVSDTLNLAATASRTQVFDSVSTAAGTKSLKQILNDAADAIEGTSAVRATDIQTSLDEIDAGAAHITGIRTDQGVRADRFDKAKDQINTIGESLAEERSGLEDTDLTYAIGEFQAKQLSLQAAQSVLAQSNKSSLFNLLG